jgi:hypothetical protein
MDLRVIPTGVHGVLDYAASGINLAFPALLGLQDAPWAALVPRMSGIAGAGYSLITDYELGAVRVLPYARAPSVRCREGRLYGVVAVAVWLRQEWHPLLAATRADGRGGCAGRDNEQDRLDVCVAE